MNDSNPYIIREEIQGTDFDIGVIQLNRPEALNAINRSMIQTITSCLTDWFANPRIQRIVFTGTEGVFSAGGDIRAIYENKSQIESNVAYFKEEYHLNRMIHHAPIPTVAYMDGITMGGGAGIAMHCQIKIATNRFVFAMPECRIGFFTDVGSRFFLTRLPGGYGLYLTLTSHSIEATESKAIGLIDHMIDQQGLSTILPILFEEDTQTIQDRLSSLGQEGVDLSNHSQRRLNPDIAEHFAREDNLETIRSGLVARNNSFANKASTSLNYNSPHSLRFALKAYAAAKDKPFDQIIKEDLAHAQYFLSHPDFYEGVRALLIDKDKNPKWAE